MLDEINKLSRVDEASTQNFHIKTARNNFVKCLSHVQTVVERRNIIPILSNILLIAENNKLTVTATDMDIVFSEQLEIEVLKPGSITVSAHLLYDIVRKLDDKSDIEILLKNNATIDIISFNCKFSLGTLPAKDFPKVEDDGYDIEFALPAEELKDTIDKIKFSISNEETRYNLNGVFFHSEKDSELKIVSTDGHRLSIMDLKGIKSIKSFEGVIIPRKAILEARKVIEEFTGEINISLSNNKAKFTSNNFVMLTKLIDAKFPSYQALIPADNDLEVIIGREAFIKAIDRVSTINNEKFRGIKLEFEGDKLTLSSSGDAGGAANEVVKLTNKISEKFDIGFNAKYLIEIMAILSGKEVVCSFKDSFSPAVILDKTNENYRHILMPMRV